MTVAVLVEPPSLIQSKGIVHLDSDTGRREAKVNSLDDSSTCSVSIREPISTYKKWLEINMVLIHAEAAGVNVLCGMAVHNLYNIRHIRGHATCCGVLCDNSPLVQGVLHCTCPTWFAIVWWQRA